MEAGEKYSTSPLYPESYGATTPADEAVQKPTILYVMDESYWDVSELEQCGYHPKIAIVMLLCGCTAEEAEKRLTEKDGYIARVVG